MKPIDPNLVPEHISRRQGGKTGLVHGTTPMLLRGYARAQSNINKKGRKGAKARAKQVRILKRQGRIG